MNEMRMSPFLTKLAESAKLLSGTRKLPFTVECFLVAAMDALAAGGPKTSHESEVRDLGLRLTSEIPNFEKAREILMAYIEKENQTTFLDDLNMKKMLQNAQARASRVGRMEILASDLVDCIFDSPTATVRSAMKQEEVAGDKPDPMTQKVFESFEQIFADPADEDGEDLLPPLEEPSPEEHRAAARADVANLIADVKKIRKHLQSVVFGQDHAIDTFATGYFQASLLSMIDKSRRQPRATFLFAGPPGVGKTFLAESAAAALELPFMRFDMSEYSEKEASIEFCGADKVYKNAKSGNVTDFVFRNPKCVLLFDEIEKSHLSVIHLFLQMLDAGRVRDNYTDKEVSFREAIIIFTTNAGKQLYEESTTGDFSTVSRKVVMQALQTDINPLTRAPFFPGAICSRFASGNVVMFNHIGAHNLHSIAKKELLRQGTNLEKELGITLQVEELVYTALLFSEGSTADARTVRARAETFFNDELYELMRLIESSRVRTGVKDVERVKITVDLSRASSTIRNLFAVEGAPAVLVFAGEALANICAQNLKGFRVLTAQTVEQARTHLKKGDVGLVLLDVQHGAAGFSLDTLNIEDVQSASRDFLMLLREQWQDLPIYLVESRTGALTEEERISYLRQGIRGILCPTKSKASFGKKVKNIADNLYQQASMVKLARESKLISFETAQAVSKNGKTAEIKLYDFKLSRAVDSEDRDSVLSAASIPNVQFADVIGAEDAKRELKYFVDYLADPKKYLGTGVKAPKGVLLYGPPGTGKTMLAKAMASEAGVCFLAAEGNQFLKSYVGEGSKAVHRLFQTARKYAPAILFVDEIDAIGKERNGQHGGVENTLTAFLTEMDGFINDPSKPVFVLAATNFDVEPGGPKSLDPALMRRFDRRIYIDLPNKAERIRFLEMKIEQNSALDISREQLENIALRSTNMSLAELDSVVELALRSAIRAGSTKVTDAILEEAFETFNSGEVRKWDSSQLERTARHEAGHALLSWLSGIKPSYLTVVARGNHGGYMQPEAQEDKGISTREELLSKIRTSLGGRAAEIACYGKVDGLSTGASGDLGQATHLARLLLCCYGMDESFGLAVENINAPMTTEVRKAVNRILSEQMDKAVEQICSNRDKLDALVNALMEKNHMYGNEIEAIILEEDSRSRISGNEE